MMEMVKAIIFDVDGVIFKSQDQNGKYLWSRNLKQDLGLGKQHCQLIYSDAWNMVTRGKIDTKDHLKNVFSDPIFDGLEITSEIFINYWLSYDNYVNTDMIEIVQSLKIPVFLGTNQDRYRTEHIKK